MKRRAAANLPRQTSAFIGREQQIKDLRRLLRDPNCRLLTLVGPGGIGKTRLAIALAAEVDGYADGVVFVPLQPVASADLLAPAIADAAGITLAGHEPLPVQLLRHLHSKQLLLILDNFEHLLAGTDLLVDILQEAPQVNLLVTSREALGLREEWRYPVPGLTLPATSAADDPTTYGALQLFAERARQVRHDFELADEVAAVLAICRAVEGMPLAIELAASWLAVLDCAAIAARLHRGLAILTTSLRNVPPRHQSIQTVFDQSWQLLTPQERDIFMRLAVFQGSISVAAAEQVADATLPIMATLVAKSLVRREADGRYYIHELLRQYGREKLAASPEHNEAAHRAHSAYFMLFCADRQPFFIDSRQHQAVQAILQELDNIRQAWQWALEHLECRWIHQMWQPLHNFHQFQSRYLEGVDLFRDASAQLDTEQMTSERAVALVGTLRPYAWLCIRLGRLDDADKALTRANQIWSEYDISPKEYSDENPMVPTMFLALTRGDYVRAESLGEQIVRMLQMAHARPGAASIPLYGLASAALAQDDYPRAKAHAEAALALATAEKDYRTMTFPLSMLGQIALAEGDLPAAKRHCEAGYAIYEKLADRGGMAEHLANLAEVALRRQTWQEAHTLYARSHALYTEVGDRGGIARTQLGLGIVAQQTEENTAARHYRLALEVAMDAQLVPVALTIAAVAGDYLLQNDGTQSLGAAALSFVLHHPSSDGKTRQQVLNTLARTGLAPDGVQATQDSLPALAAALQAALAAMPTVAAAARADLHVQQLIEPLTLREAEVLQLLAAGQSNPAIAAALVVTTGTVKSHTSRIYAKLGVTNRTQAVVRARTLGLLA